MIEYKNLNRKQILKA